MTSWKAHFSKTIEANPGRLHFAAHSHHPWPDVTLDAHTQYWHDTAQLLDHKWDKKIPALEAQVKGHLARRLNLPGSDTLVFGQNTHEFLLRILSCFDPRQKIKVLTTDSEFHSLRRQLGRLEEAGMAEVIRIPVHPIDTFTQRFSKAAQASNDLIYFSHVFFDSGLIAHDLEEVVASVKNENTFLVVDGYHSFMALPVDLSRMAARIFYIAGGYKYAMAGEGAVFMHVPPGYGERPLNTGWYAAFDALADERSNDTPYAATAERFRGATFDPSGLYRMNAVQTWLDEQGLTVEAVHDHAYALQAAFLQGLQKHQLTIGDLLNPLEEAKPHARFLTFQTKKAGTLSKALDAQNVVTDHRGDRLRFGFSIYQDETDVEDLFERLETVL